METIGWAVVLIITAVGVTCTAVNAILELRNRLRKRQTIEPAASSFMEECAEEYEEEPASAGRDDSLAVEALTEQLQDAVRRSSMIRTEIRGLQLKIVLAKRDGARTGLN